MEAQNLDMNKATNNDFEPQLQQQRRNTSWWERASTPHIRMLETQKAKRSNSEAKQHNCATHIC